MTVTVLSLLVNSMAGYALAKLRFRRREALFQTLSAGLVLPAQVAMLPLFLMFKEMGLVNTVVPVGDLERETVAWCREMLALSPLALRLLKASFTAEEDGLTGLQQLSHDATLLFYMTEEGQEGRNAYVEGRRPDFTKFPRRP